MPCRDPRDDQDERDADHMKQGGEYLCRLCQGFDRMAMKLPYEIAVWWNEHQLRDRQKALEQGEKE